MPHADPEAAREYHRRYREKHRETRRQKQREYYYANREEINRRQRERRAGNPEHAECQRRYWERYRVERREELSEYKKQWGKAHPDRGRKYYYANREEISERRRQYRAANIEEVRRRERERYASNPQAWLEYARRRRARLRQVPSADFTLEQWYAKVAYWGNRCWVCGGDWSAQDHVKPISRNGADMLCNLRPICNSCNSRKKNKWPIGDLLGVHASHD